MLFVVQAIENVCLTARGSLQRFTPNLVTNNMIPRINLFMFNLVRLSKLVSQLIDVVCLSQCIHIRVLTYVVWHLNIQQSQ